MICCFRPEKLAQTIAPILFLLFAYRPLGENLESGVAFLLPFAAIERQVFEYFVENYLGVRPSNNS